MEELEFKGTKVEWKHHDKAKGNIVANNRLVANCMGYTTNQDNGEHITESLANAQLIVAAPKLLKASIEAYVELQQESNINIKLAVKTDMIRACLRDSIAESLNLESEFVQGIVEKEAMKRRVFN